MQTRKTPCDSVRFTYVPREENHEEKPDGEKELSQEIPPRWKIHIAQNQISDQCSINAPLKKIDNNYSTKK